MADAVDVRTGPDGRAHFSGLVLCGNVWACPCCANKIALGRTAELQALLDRNAAAGGSAVFQTFTIPHDFTDGLRKMARVVTRTFRRLLQGKQWQALKSQLGIIGQVRALEVTHGGAGWHPHSHALFLSARRLTAAEAAQLGERNAALWCQAVQSAGLRAPLHDLQPAELVHGDAGRYMAKMGAALEMTRGAGKRGRRGGRTPWQILTDFRLTGDDADLQLWRQYERGMRGLKQLTWSHGLRARFGIGDPTDAELAEAEIAGAQTVLQLDGPVWARVVRVPGGPARLLEAAEAGGADGAYDVALEICRRWADGDRLPLRIAEGIRKRFAAAVAA